MKLISQNKMRASNGTPRRSMVLMSLAIAAAVAGCSGGGKGTTAATSSPDTGASGIEATYGEFTTRVVGPAQAPVVSATAGSTVTGIAGASFTAIYQNRSAESLTLKNTRIAYASRDANSVKQLFTIPPTGGVPTQITSGAGDKDFPRWQPAGTRIAYQAKDASGVTQIFTISSIGGAPTQITTGSSNKYLGGYSPDGTKIVYNSQDADRFYQIYSVPATGGTPTQITTGKPDKFQPAISPDGTKVAFIGLYTNTRYQVFVMPLSGGTPQQVTSEERDSYWPAWSPDGLKIAYHTVDQTGLTQIRMVPASGGSGYWLTNGSSSAQYPSWSPDGTQLTSALYDNHGYTQIATSPASGGSPVPITAGDGSKDYPSWSPFLNPTVTLVGSGGILGAGSAGFLFGQSGKTVTSVVAFDTGTGTVASRVQARVDNLTPAGAALSNLVFSITAGDFLSKLSYNNYDDTGSPKKTVNVSLPASAAGAVVSFDAASGQVATVLPYTASRGVGSKTPQVRMEGKTLVITGPFVAAFDGSGTRHELAGQHTVRLDATTGKLRDQN